MTSKQFTEIAPFYDALMAGVPYRYWVDYVEEILQELDYHPRTVLDAACGTGNVSEILAGRGYEVTGVDISLDMIQVAVAKEHGGSDVRYIVQDIAELSLGRTFDLILSLFDSLNYMVEPERLQAAIERVADHLVPGGIFIFDVNTEYALAHGYFNQTNIGSRAYPKYVWASEYDKEARVCSITMVFEVLDGGSRRQFTEIHRQRAYSLEELGLVLGKAEMETLNTYHAYSFKKPGRRSDRVFFVARKRGPETQQVCV